jgi:hypothetical protein
MPRRNGIGSRGRHCAQNRRHAFHASGLPRTPHLDKGLDPKQDPDPSVEHQRFKRQEEILRSKLERIRKRLKDFGLTSPSR